MAGFSCEFNLFIICLQIKKEWKIINVLIEYSKVIILKKNTYKKWGEQAPRISLWHRISDSSVIKVMSKKSSSFRNSLKALDKFEGYSFHLRQYLSLSIVDILNFLRGKVNIWKVGFLWFLNLGGNVVRTYLIDDNFRIVSFKK